MIADLIWTTVKRNISELKALDNNPRTITEEKYNKLDKSIGDVGNFKPLVADFDLTILGGNQRLRALISNGFTEVEVSVPSRPLTEHERQRIVILDNIHAGEFDMDILANEFDEELLVELDFDLPDTDLSNDDLIEPKPAQPKTVTCPHCGTEFNPKS